MTNINEVDLYQHILEVKEGDHPILAAIKQRLATQYYFIEDEGFRKKEIPSYVLEASLRKNLTYVCAASQTEVLVDVISLLDNIFNNPRFSRHREEFLK